MLEEIGKQVVELLKQKMIDENLVVTGKLLNSVHYVVGNNQVDILFEEYAKYIDTGTKPHYVGREGVERIKEWASIKGVSPWGVITNIRLYGTKPHPYLKSLFPDIDSIVKNNTDIFMSEQSKIIFENLKKSFK